MIELTPAKYHKKGRIHLFESYADFLKGAMRNTDMAESDRHSRWEKGREKWAGGTWDEAIKIAPGGDVKQATALRAGIIKEATRIVALVPRLDPVYQVEGGQFIDVSRFVNGEPEVWGQMIETGGERKAKRACIVFNAGANCDIKSKDYERAARLIGGAILGLKAMGASVSLHLCYHNESYGDSDITAINMTCGEALDVARLAAATRTWFFRRLVFSWWETQPAAWRDNHNVCKGGGYGHSARMTEEDARAVTGHAKATILNMEEMTFWDDNRIREAIMATIKEGGTK